MRGHVLAVGLTLRTPEDELVIMKLADSKYEVTDFLMEYPK